MTNDDMKRTLQTWLAENLEGILGKAGEAVGADEALTNLLLRFGFTRSDKVLEALTMGGEQAVILIGAELGNYLQRVHGMSDDAARLVVLPIQGFIRGFLTTVGKDHVAHTDHEGLRNALHTFWGKRQKAPPAMSGRSKVCTDEVRAKWAAEVGDPATFQVMLGWKDWGRTLLQRYAGAGRPLSVWANVVVDHGDFGYVGANMDFVSTCIRLHNWGATEEDTAVALIAVVRSNTEEALEGRVSGYTRNNLIAGVAQSLQRLTEGVVGQVERLVPLTFWVAIGSMAMFLGSVISFVPLVLCLFWAIFHSQHDMTFWVTFVAMLVVYVPFTVSVGMAAAGPATVKAFGRGVHKALSILPGVDPPGEVELLENIRKAGTLQHLQQSVRYTILQFFIYLGAGWFLLDTSFSNQVIADTDLLRLWFLFNVPVTVSLTSSYLSSRTLDPKDKGLIGLAMVGRRGLIGLSVVTGLEIFYSISMNTPVSAPLRGVFPFVTDLPHWFASGPIGATVAILSTLLCSFSLVLGTVAVRDGLKGKVNVKAMVGTVAIVLLLLGVHLGGHQLVKMGIAPEQAASWPGSAASAVVPGVQNVQVAAPAAQSDAFTQLGLQSQQAVW